VQSLGTAAVSVLFGPVCVLWFLALATAGAAHIASNPDVLLAVNPMYGLDFLVGHRMIGFITLGLVFLAVTGSEAIYADLGHFGRRPVQVAWVGFVLPSLVINYFGQGALVLANPKALESPFFLLYPDWALYPMVALATAATVIASQAVITGAYSVTSQASSSSALATAYGIAVTGTMVVTTLMVFVVIWKMWKWNVWAAAALVVPFLAVDLTFLFANLVKIVEGGWITVVVGALIAAVIWTWRSGARLLFEKTRKLEVPIAALVKNLERHPPHHVPGTAVFLTSDPQSAPTALLHSLKHYKVLHEYNMILTVETADVPRVAMDERVRIEPISETFSRLTIRYGFMEAPNVPKALALARAKGWHFDIMSTSFFLSRRSLRQAAKSGMPRWQDRLFVALARTANDATDYFQIPTSRVVEIGTQVAI
jgi:KUP system potassium uptake protein